LTEEKQRVLLKFEKRCTQAACTVCVTVVGDITELCGGSSVNLWFTVIGSNSQSWHNICRWLPEMDAL